MKESGWELYKQGETVSGIECQDGVSLSHYEDIAQDVREEKSTAQFGFDREIYLTKLPKYIIPESKIEITYSWGRYEE